MGLDSLPSIDPFNDIAPMMVELNESCPPFQNHAICDLSPELKSICYSREDVSDEEEEVWGPAQQMIEIFLTLSTSSMMKMKIYSC